MDDIELAGLDRLALAIVWQAVRDARADYPGAREWLLDCGLRLLDDLEITYTRDQIIAAIRRPARRHSKRMNHHRKERE